MKKNSFGAYRENESQDWEDTVDADTGSVVKPKKKEKAKSTQVFALFAPYCHRAMVPGIWLANRTQRDAAEILFDERGIEQISAALKFAHEHKDEEFFPHVNTPYDLANKWPNIIKYKKDKGL